MATVPSMIQERRILFHGIRGWTRRSKEEVPRGIDGGVDQRRGEDRAGLAPVQP